MKLGKGPVRHDPRTLQLSKYLDIIPPYPPVCDWGKNTPIWGMMLNDNIGDCTCAAAGHQIMAWCNENEVKVNITDGDILEAYKILSGYDPNNGTNDNGAVELDVLNLWRKRGIAGHKLLAFAALQKNNTEHVKSACWMFGGVYIGLALPSECLNQEVWDVIPGMEKGSLGGHAVPVIGYNEKGPICITWGFPKQMTWEFYLAFCDEAYALLGTEWMGTGGATPSGFKLDLLISDLKLVTTGVGQSEPQVTPTPSTGGSTMFEKIKAWFLLIQVD